jgi:hypothetical protein
MWHALADTRGLRNLTVRNGPSQPPSGFRRRRTPWSAPRGEERKGEREREIERESERGT